jgi:hypothetical protein
MLLDDPDQLSLMRNEFDEEKELKILRRSGHGKMDHSCLMDGSLIREEMRRVVGMLCL